MSDESPRKPRKILSYGLVVLAVGLVLLFFQLLSRHGTRLPPTVRIVEKSNRQADTAFDDIREMLRKEPGIVACRNAIRQLNAQSVPPAVWSDAERESLRKEFHLNDEELAELSGSVYTALDAHHLDQCFLLQDAARSLGPDSLSVRDRALAGFAWVMRQVRLQNDAGPAGPP